MNGITLFRVDRSALIDWISSDVEYSAENAFTNRHRDRGRRIGNRHPALQPFGGRHRDCSNPTTPKVLLYFQGQLFRRTSLHLEVDLQRVVDAWHPIAFTEIGIHNGANDLDNGTCIHIRSYPTASCAVVISSSSVVIFSWRTLLYSRVKSLINSLALSVAFFIATIRALCSDALAFSAI